MHSILRRSLRQVSAAHRQILAGRFTHSAYQSHEGGANQPSLKRPFMRGIHVSMIAGLLLAGASPVAARSALAIDDAAGAGGSSDPYVLQCVPYARDLSGIRLYGDAHTWWGQAQGKYARGRVPRPGAVLAIRPHGNSTLGHVAMVSRVVDTRTILISHANWSAPGKIERNVTAVDVSPGNDWSQVRVWFAPARNLGAAHWPVSGFIYNAKPGREPVFTPAKTRLTLATKPTAVSRMLSVPKSTNRKRAVAKVNARRDPIGAIIAGSY